MARRRRKKSHPTPTSTPAPDVRPKPIATGLIVSILAALILGGIPFGIGKYIEFNSPGPFDSGSYVYSAKHLLNGAKLGVDELSSAKPNTLLVNIIGVKLFGFSETGPKIVQMMLQLGAFVFMFITLRKMFGPFAAVFGTTLAAIYLSAPLIAKFGNVKEQFMIPFMIAAACSFLWYSMNQKKYWYWLVLCGFFAIQPFYFKPTGLSIVIALILFIISTNFISRNLKKAVSELGLFLAGYCVGLLVPGTVYFLYGKAGDLLSSLPVVALKAGLMLVIFLAVVIGIALGMKRLKLIGQLRHVSGRIWITGSALIVLVFLAAIVMIKAARGSTNDDILSYINNISFIAFPRYLCIMLEAQISHLAASVGLEGYVAQSAAARGLSDLARQIFRYYKALSLPILAALCSIIAAFIIRVRSRVKKTNREDIQSKIVWMLAIWWILDMAFIWISPRSYEQYYLPLCGSASVLSGYAVWVWQKQLTLAQNKIPWLAGGLVATIIFGCMTIPIFAGQRCSPDTGYPYQIQNPQTGQMIPVRRRGFGPDLKELPFRKKEAWITIGNYIRTHSTEKDTIYVWGWVPGIYVQAQRFSPIAKASEGNMHVMPPADLRGQVLGMVKKMKKNPPKFIVDSRKIHFPNDRPPLELWPHLYSREKPYGQPIPDNPAFIAQYDTLYKQLLSEKFDPKDPKYSRLPELTCWLGRVPPPWTKAMPDEAKRYDAMKPFRDFVMKHYQIVGHFGAQVLFQYKPPANERTQ